jgi:fatty acid desaturase
MSVVSTPAEETAFAATPYRRGYSLPYALRPEIAAAHRTRLFVTVGAALLDHLICYVAVLGAAWVALRSPWHLGAVLVVAASAVAGRQLRALENLVHEASHFNWSRRRRRLNDVLATVLASCPTGALIKEYRASHLLHHGRFGTAHDPDRVRYVELDIEQLRRDSPAGFMKDLISRLPRYQVGWLRTIASTPVAVLLPTLWPVAVVLPAASAAYGLDVALLATGSWLAGYLLALPVIRMIAESEEHSYTGAQTVFDATLSNVGRWQGLLFHPHNDGYHNAHHLWPGIPHHSLRRVHELLMREDAEGYGKRVPLRTRVLSAVPHIEETNDQLHA